MNNEVMFILPGIKNKVIRRIIDNPVLNIDRTLNKASIPYKLIPVSIYQGILGNMINSRRGLDEVLYALKIFSAGAKHYTGLLINECLYNRPDIIIYDYTFFPAIAVSEKLKIPRVAAYHSGLPFPEYPIPPFGSDYKYNEYSEEQYDNYWKLFIAKEYKTKRKYEKVIKQQISTNFILSPSSDLLNIVNTIKEAEYPRNSLPDSVLFTGPIGQEYMNKQAELFFNKKTKRLIYISLGTVFNNQPELFIRIIKSIEMDDTEILVAAGSSYGKLKSFGFKSNVHIYKFVPQLNVLSNTDVFITHGGKNSINEALKYGVPMILFPAGGEQIFNANLIEFLKVGINFRGIKKTFTPEYMNNAIKKLLNDVDVIRSVNCIAIKHEGMDGAEIAYDNICNRMHNLKKKKL